MPFSFRLFSVPLGIFAAMLALPGGGSAQSFAATHAKVSIISDESAFKPGQTALIGVLFDLEKGWHIYWENPGDSGEPPRIQWQLPAGLQVKGVRWPTPVRLGTGTVVDYGYEGRVLLPVPLEVASNFQGGKPATVSANIRYLICREVCIPAKAQASLTIPSSSAAGNAADRELFRNASENTPKPLPAGSKAEARDAGHFFTLTVDTGMSESNAAFFPLEQDQIDNAAAGQTPTATSRGVQIKLKKSDQLTKPISMLRGVVVFGPGRAYDIAAPVTGKK